MGWGYAAGRSKGKALEGPHSPFTSAGPRGSGWVTDWETQEHESQGREVRWQNRTRQEFTFHHEEEKPHVPQKDQKNPPSCTQTVAAWGTEKQLRPAHLHALHHHQLFHQGLGLACQVHGALEQDQRVDCGEASFVRLLRVHGQHHGDAERTETQGWDLVSWEALESRGGQKGWGQAPHNPPPLRAFPSPFTTISLGAGYLLMRVPHCSAWLRSWGLLRLARISPSFKRECSIAVQEAGGEKEMQEHDGKQRRGRG